MIYVVKKDNSLQEYDFKKVEKALQKTSLRCGIELTTQLLCDIETHLHAKLINGGDITRFIKVADLHTLVEQTLAFINPALGKEYIEFRDYKLKMKSHFEEMLKDTEQLLNQGDNENANRDSFLIDAQKMMTGEIFSVRNMLDYELPRNASKAHTDGDIYIHDLRDRLYNSINCCLFDMARVLKGGFTYNGVQYNEPNSISTACRMLQDIMNSARQQQYGGFTVPEIDTVLAPYVRKTFVHYQDMAYGTDLNEDFAMEMAYKDLVQGLESIEHSLHMVNNTFVTFTFGLDTSLFGSMVSKALLQVRRRGLGATGIPAVFPKLVFLYRDELHGVDKELSYLFDDAVATSAKCMYPDFLSLDNGYLGDIYKGTGKAISPMGCRAFLSDYKNEQGESVFVGRANCGAVTLNLPRYALKSYGSVYDFYYILEENFKKALKVHQFTYNRMSKVKAKTNPLFFVHGGCHIQLNPNDTIKPALDTFTWSIGYIGLEETVYALTGKHLHEDNTLAIEILTFIHELIEDAKKETGLRLALYSTPAESLCYKFKEKDELDYGTREGVTDKEYYTNSFHCDVRAKLEVDEKMHIELPMFNIATGGRIVYNEYPHTKNLVAIADCVRYAMKLGLYYGINLQLDTCLGCGHQEEIADACPKCGATNILKINRICGYLSYTSTENGENMVNRGKTGEIEKRVDHFN